MPLCVGELPRKCDRYGGTGDVCGTSTIVTRTFVTRMMQILKEGATDETPMEHG